MKNKYTQSFLFLLAFCFAVPAMFAEAPKDVIKNDLVKAVDGNFVPATLDANVKYIALYFSAKWCPPCRKFTPKLVEYYNSINAQEKQFEVVFCSADRDPEGMISYMSTYGMKWPALKYQSRDLLGHYAGDGIPCLVLIDATTGKVISASYIDGEYRSPYPVLEEIKALLK